MLPNYCVLEYLYVALRSDNFGTGKTNTKRGCEIQHEKMMV